MSYLLFAWISSLLYGSLAVFAKLTSKYSIKNQFLFNFLYYGSILLWTIPLALLNHAGLPKVWLNILLTGFFYACSGLFYILALYELDVSTISPLYNLQTAFAVILAVIILHQELTFFQYILVGIIFLAGIFTSIDEKLKLKSFFHWSILTAVASTFALGLGSVYIHKALGDNSFWTVTLWTPLISQSLLCLTIPFFVKHVNKKTIKALPTIIFLGLLDTVGLLTAYKAYAVNVPISAVIISLPISMLLVITLAGLFPKLLEKHTSKVYVIRITAAIIMVIAALKLSIG